MKRIIAIATSYLLLFTFPQNLALAGARQAASGPLESLLQKNHLELFEQASEVRVSKPLIEHERQRLKREKEAEGKRLKDERKRIEEDIDRAQGQLKELNRQPETPEVAGRRHELHCAIQASEKELQEAKLALQRGLDIRYDNKLAKLQILEEWPGEYREARQLIEQGTAGKRKFGDFRDIGFRDGPWKGQEKDLETGREAILELKRRGLLPPEVEDEAVVAYVRELSGRIARHSDLKVPLEVHILKSQEINAFALPGGFLFINSGLILEARRESELAGVIAHEIAHVTARHGDRLMTKANIAAIIFQAAQVAALIFSGGISSIGAYYALQYGFLGLGLVMNLTLLGVTREYEIEADILGTQYLWGAGYDTRGFISFFSHMAEKEGYITGLSWFRTHPPFYKRMSETFLEITFLPNRDEVVDDRSEFHQTQEKLKAVMAEMEEKDRDAPTLKRVYDCDSKK